MLLIRILMLVAAFISEVVIAAEPIVVLNYSAQATQNGSDNMHPFVTDPDFSSKHEVSKDETLSDIIKNYYGGSGMNFKFVQMAIVQLNKTAFVRGNPNFMFAGKTIHLPSINEITSLIMDKGSRSSTTEKFERRDEIFFFGS